MDSIRTPFSALLLVALVTTVLGLCPMKFSAFFNEPSMSDHGMHMQHHASSDTHSQVSKASSECGTCSVCIATALRQFTEDQSVQNIQDNDFKSVSSLLAFEFSGYDVPDVLPPAWREAAFRHLQVKTHTIVLRV